jgi:hypothetical protein
MSTSKLSLFLLCYPLLAQTTITVSPANQYKLAATVWNVSVCSAVNVNISFGQIFAVMSSHGLQPMLYSEAQSLLNATPSRSPMYRVLQAVAYTSAAASVLTVGGVIKTNSSWQTGITAGSGFLNVITPLLQRSVPAVPVEIQSGLINGQLRVPGGDCSVGIILGVSGQNFTQVLP